MEPGDIVVSGLGVTSAIGQGRAAFAAALLEGRHAFDVMSRSGRQLPGQAGEAGSAFLGAEIAQPALPASIAPGLLRTASLGARMALATAHEAWEDAQLQHLPPGRIGLVVGGSDVQQRHPVQMRDAWRGREAFTRPNYGRTLLDSDLCGLCTEVLGPRGFALTVGCASASAQVAVLEAAQAGLAAADIGYVNPHGTGSGLGDEKELEALRRCGLAHARLNATKSITGHGLRAAGAVELVALLLQIQAGRLHPTRNLRQPMDDSLRWVGASSEEHTMRNALNLSMGFGGINTALCVQAVQA